MKMPMKVLLYFENSSQIGQSGIGKALEHQKAALDSVGVEYTLNPKENYDILHINTVFLKSSAIIDEARKKGAKIIYHAHSTEEDFRNSFLFSNLMSQSVKKRLISLYSKADYILTPTPYSKHLLETYGIEKPIQAISNGIDLTKFKKDSMKEKAFRDYFNFSADQKIVMASGLWIKRKGILDFIEVARSFPDVKFIWFGQTPLVSIPNEIRLAVTKDHPNNVIFPGYMKGDIYFGAFSAADVFFFPSFEETEGIVVLEAMACNTSVLLRDIPVYDKWMQDGINCYKGKNNKDFVRILNDVFSGTAVSIVKEGYKTAEERSIEKIGQQLKDVYKHVYEDITIEQIRAYGKSRSQKGKLNIGLFSDTFTPDINGVSISVQTLKTQLEKMGHNVYVITPTIKTKLVGVEFTNGILRIPAIKLEKLYGYRLSQPYNLKAIECIKEMNLDICHINTEFSMRILALWVAMAYNIPTVATYHTMYEDYTHYVTRGHFEKPSKKIVGWYSKNLFEKKSELIVPSKKTADALKRYGVTKHMHIIPTGIDTDRFSPKNIDEKNITQIKKKYGLVGKYCLAYVGRLAPEKGLDNIINILPLILNKYDDIGVLIVGYGPSLETLKLLVVTLGLESKVSFTGKISPNETQNYYAAADLFMTASTSETQGITYVEAMGAGIPVVAKYDTCINNIVIEGETGFFFNNDEEFVNAVLKCYNMTDEERSVLSKNCLKKSEEFSLEKFGANVLNVYYQAIVRKQRMLERKTLTKSNRKAAKRIYKASKQKNKKYKKKAV